MSSTPSTASGAFTLLDEGRPWSGSATLEGETPWLAPQALRDATGWDLKPQGLCRNDVCVPITAAPHLVRQGLVNLNTFADVLGRPLVVDAGARAAYLGASAGARANRLASLEAPDFELPDLAGKLHRLSDQRGRKVLLVAYASW